MSNDLAALIARVEAATGPDRALDAAIETLGYPVLAKWPRSPQGGWVSPEWGLIAPPSHYTSSLDAALALVERVLPGALYEVKALPHRRGHGASLWSDDPSAERMLSRADAPTPALALILALLRAPGAAAVTNRQAGAASGWVRRRAKEIPMTELYWCYPGDQPGGPYDITIARAETPQQACQLFGERFPSPCVHKLTSPLLVALYDDADGTTRVGSGQATISLTVGATASLRVERLPSAYDEFRTGYRNGVDFEAMADRGFDVS